MVEGRPQTPRQDDSSVMQEASIWRGTTLKKAFQKRSGAFCLRPHGRQKSELYRLIAAMDAPKQENAEKGGDSPCPR